MDANTKQAIGAVSSEAVKQHLFPYSVCLFDTKDETDPSNGWAIFSGTLVEIGRHLFVATASHCVENGDAPTRYWIIPDKPGFLNDGVPRVVRAIGSPEDHPDVGLLEVDKSTIALLPSKRPCGLAQLKTEGYGRTNRLVALIGSPQEYLSEETRGAARGFKAVVISYNSVPLTRSEWPSILANPPFDENNDILMDYPSGSQNTTRLDTAQPIELPHPGGMSGGGLWDQGFNGQEIWSPNGVFLFGIQSRWNPDRRYIRAVQIKHWLRLVHQHYPDLRQEIDSAFPELHDDTAI